MCLLASAVFRVRVSFVCVLVFVCVLCALACWGNVRVLCVCVVLVCVRVSCFDFLCVTTNVAANAMFYGIGITNFLVWYPFVFSLPSPGLHSNEVALVTESRVSSLGLNVCTIDVVACLYILVCF